MKHVLQYTNLEPETGTQPLLELCFQLNVTSADIGLPDVSSSSVDLSDELYSSDSVNKLPSKYLIIAGVFLSVMDNKKFSMRDYYKFSGSRECKNSTSITTISCVANNTNDLGVNNEEYALMLKVRRVRPAPRKRNIPDYYESYTYVLDR